MTLKIVFLSAIFVMASAVGLAADKAACGPNTLNSVIKRVCMTTGDDGKTLVSLYGAARGPIHLKAVKEVRTGYGEEEGGDVTWHLSVAEIQSDGSLSSTRSTVLIHTTWEYSAGATDVSGKTPGGMVFSATVEDTYP